MSENIQLLLDEVLLGILSIAFVAWAGVVWKASHTLTEKFDEMRKEFHEYTINTEHRLTRLEQTEQRIYELIKTFGDKNESE